MAHGERTDYNPIQKSIVRKPFFEYSQGGLGCVDQKKIIFVGIIDIFTQYG